MGKDTPVTLEATLVEKAVAAKKAAIQQRMDYEQAAMVAERKRLTGIFLADHHQVMSMLYRAEAKIQELEKEIQSLRSATRTRTKLERK